MRNSTRLCLLMALAALLLPLTLSAQYLVSGSGDPDANGVYQQVGEYNRKPLYSNGLYRLFYKDCTTKWAIGLDFESHPYYSSNVDGDVPSNEGWHVGGKYTGEVHGTVMVARMNSMAYDKQAVVESRLNDGTFNDSIRMLLYATDDPFTGENGDDFVADGKVTVSNLPEGLSISVIRKSDNILVAYITGTVTGHLVSNNVNNLTLAFTNSTFTDGLASDIAYSTNAGLHVLFMEKYLAFGANESPDVNGLYFLAGLFNNRPYYVNTDSTYDFKYKGCQWGAQWALTDEDGGCPYYSTSVNSETLPGDGWYDEGQGDGTEDTLFVVPVNGLYYSTLMLNEDTADNGSIADTLVIAYIFRENGNAFTGSNGDDFVTAGKAVVSNLPEGLTASLIRLNDTTLVFKLNGQATSHEFANSVDNLSLTLNDAAFTGGDASLVGNATMDYIQVNFMPEIVVSGAHFYPGANGIYKITDIYNGKPLFAKDDYLIAYRDCNAKWILKQDDPDGCPLYSTAVDGDLPIVGGWSDGGSGGSGQDSIVIGFSNSLLMNKKVFSESLDDNGSIPEPLAVTLYDPNGNNRFTGDDTENFVATGKVSFANVPEGFEAAAIKLNDSTVLLGLGGNAAHHEFADNVSNIEVTFNNTAFISGNAAEVYNHTISGMSIFFLKKYEVIGAMGEPDVNGTYLASGYFNNKPYYTKGEYVLGYRNCDAKWVIVDGGIPDYLESGYCPVYRNENDTEWPPVNGWNEPEMVVYPYMSLYTGNAVFNESKLHNNVFEGKDTVVIAYIFPHAGSAFSGNNGSDFVADGKVTITNLPDGLTASLLRTGDTTLAMTVKGQSLAGTDQAISLIFNDNAFTGTTAGRVQFADALEILLEYRDEFLVASAGGDFVSIREALQSMRVSDGDILNLAAETFTEYNLAINKSLTIRGQGSGKTIVQATPTPGTSAFSIFNGNFSSNGGAVLVIENMTLRNGAYNQGGAVNARYVQLFINNCELVDNIGYNNGGAIYINPGSLVCTNSTFTGNRNMYSTTSSYYGGGAIWVEGNSYEWPGSRIENTTFTGNGTLAYGGALHSNSEVDVINCTFSGNSAYRGGSMYRYGQYLRLTNTLVANNTASNAGPDIYGSLNANFSLIENTSGATINGADNITGTDPGLLPLADNGGLTRTCAIGALSAAADKGTNTGTPASDQRGIPVFNTTRDIGAYEYNNKPIITVSESTMSFEVAINVTIATPYTVSAINLTSPLIIKATGLLLIRSEDGTFIAPGELQLDPDVNGTISATNITALVTANDRGTRVDSLIHASTGADTVKIPVTVMALTQPSGDNGSLTLMRNISHDFVRNDFFFADPDGSSMAGIVVVSKETNGDLEHNGVNVTDGSVCAGITGLNFRPYADAYGKPYATFTFKVMDNAGLLSKEAYTMTINVNYVPELQNPIPDGNATVGTAYSYMVPDNTFNDPDASVDPVYSATLADGSPLPAWLICDGTGTFSGTPVEAGTLTIKVTVTDEENASGSDEFVLTIGATGVGDNGSDKDVAVFPNPTDGLVTVTIPVAKGSMVMKVTNLTGTVVLMQQLNAERNQVDLSAFPAGVYLMHLSNEKQTAIRRIVVN